MSRRTVNFRRTGSRCGFTLLETALATIIIGVGVTSLCELLAKGTVSNISAAEQTTGYNLAKNIRELCLNLSFTDPVTPSVWGLDGGESATNYASWNDLNDLDGLVLSPPIDAQRNSLTNFAGWTQSIVVHSVDPNNMTSDVPDGTTAANRITVTVTHNGNTVCTMTWFAFNGAP